MYILCRFCQKHGLNQNAIIKGLEKTMAREAERNMAYRTYAEDAHMFLYGIRPDLSENDSGCEDPNCKSCQEMAKENDIEFADILRNPDDYVKKFKKFQAVVSPDSSLFWDAPFAAQVINKYRNHAINHFTGNK